MPLGSLVVRTLDLVVRILVVLACVLFNVRTSFSVVRVAGLVVAAKKIHAKKVRGKMKKKKKKSMRTEQSGRVFAHLTVKLLHA